MIKAVKGHMHVQQQLGPKLEKASNHQSTKCYTKYQELIKEGILKKCKCHLCREKMSCSAAQI
jgi:hypothetical protein